MRGLISFGAALIATVGFGNEPLFLEAKKLASPPTLDGIVNPDEWATAVSFEGAFDEDYGTPRPQPVKFYLAYDAQYIYFAAQVTYSNPKAIRAREFRQNASLQNDDTATLVIDPFGRTGSYNRFSFNYRGGTSINIAGGRAAKVEWLGEIRARGRRTETGWEGEARIPWAVMRLPNAGIHSPAINAAVDESASGRDYEWRFGQSNDSHFVLWKEVQIPPGSPRSIKLLPYFYGGIDARDRHVANMGLDLKTSLSEQLDFVGTISPDFRNIENQILSLDFSRFERLAGEARPFFQEGSQFYQTSFDSPIFNSTRIGKFDTGAKTFGQIGKSTQVGVLQTLDFGNESNTVAAVRERFSDQLSGRFGFASRSQSGEGQKNDATFASLSYSGNRWFGFAQASGTKDRSEGFGRRYNVGLNYGHLGTYAGAEYLEVSERYRPRLGFSPERNLRGYAAYHGREFQTKGLIREWDYNIFGSTFDRLNGNAYRRDIGLNGSVEFRNFYRLGFGANFSEFEASKDTNWFLGIFGPTNDRSNSYDFTINSGRIDSQTYTSLSASVNRRWSVNLNTSLSFQETRLGSERDLQGILTASYDLDEFWSLSGRAVRRDSDWNAYVAIRRAGNRGAEYFAIFGDPNTRTFQRSLILKAVIPFELRF